MLPFALQTPRDLARTLASRVKTLRLARGWTQSELAERAGIALTTYQCFERTGQISLDRLLKLAVILDAQDGFEGIFTPPAASSLAELEARTRSYARKRGVRRRA